jgi:heavy metal translocating P-type ATPase
MDGEHICDLCSLPLGRSPVERAFESGTKNFCCAGCLNVYTILLESGVIAQGGDFRASEIYQQSLRLGLIFNGRVERPPLPEGVETKEALYQVSGMWCTACGWLVEHALMREYGVISAEVLFTSDLLKVTYAPQYVEPGRIPGRVCSLGYRAVDYGSEEETGRAEWRDFLLRLGLAGGLWMNVMLFSLVVYAAYFQGAVAGWARHAVPFVLMGLATPAVFYSAWPIHRLAWFGLRERVIRMEALISLGVLAAYGYSTAQAFLGGPQLYFDTACAIVTLVLAGKALERGAKEKTAKAVSMLYRLMPKKARLCQEGRERFVSLDAVQAGMTVLVKPGERIPVDGVVIEGTSSVDESVVTGESEPRSKAAGAEVVSGSLNSDGVLTLRVTRAGDESTLARIIRAVERALASRMPMERFVDRVSRHFIPAVIGISLATFAGCLLAGLPFTAALLRATAVLVIACPCALGIATPLATTTAIGAASHHGVLIRDAQILERFRSVDVVVLDKTGTATEGEFRVRELALAPVAAGRAGAAVRDPLALLASIEAYSEHPLAQGVVRYALGQSVEPMEARGIEVRAGMGIAGTVAGVRVAAGNRRMMAAEGVPAAGELESKAQTWEAEALTVSFFAVDGEAAGALAFGDRVRAETPALVHALSERGVRTALISGDAEATTARIAARLGISEFRGEVAPADKAEAVRAFQKHGAVVAMVGDGINDAPALAAADLGIAMGTGADLAMHAAPVVLMGGSLMRIVETFDLAARTLRIIKQNLFWAFFYNVIGISLAVTGVLNPILSAAAMVFSSFSVIGNSLRLGRRQ